MTPLQESMIAQWWAAKAKLDGYEEAREEELRIRKSLPAALFGGATKEGVNNFSLPNGYTMKVTLGVERKVDKEKLPALREPLEAAGAKLDALIRWKAELETKAYKGLTREQRVIMNQALTTTDKTPTVEVVPPKEEKK